MEFHYRQFLPSIFLISTLFFLLFLFTIHCAFREIHNKLTTLYFELLDTHTDTYIIREEIRHFTVRTAQYHDTIVSLLESQVELLQDLRHILQSAESQSSSSTVSTPRPSTPSSPPPSPLNIVERRALLSAATYASSTDSSHIYTSLQCDDNVELHAPDSDYALGCDEVTTCTDHHTPKVHQTSPPLDLQLVVSPAPCSQLAPPVAQVLPTLRKIVPLTTPSPPPTPAPDTPQPLDTSALLDAITFILPSERHTFNRSPPPGWREFRDTTLYPDQSPIPLTAPLFIDTHTTSRAASRPWDHLPHRRGTRSIAARQRRFQKAQERLRRKLLLRQDTDLTVTDVPT